MIGSKCGGGVGGGSVVMWQAGASVWFLVTRNLVLSSPGTNASLKHRSPVAAKGLFAPPPHA